MSALKTRSWARYWAYYTAADFIGLFVGVIIYHYYFYPSENIYNYKPPPDMAQLISISMGLIYSWYWKTFYLPIQVIAFFALRQRIRTIREYYTSHRIVVLLIHTGVVLMVTKMLNDKIFYIPFTCILVCNCIAFYQIESRGRSLT